MQYNKLLKSVDAEILLYVNIEFSILTKEKKNSKQRSLESI